MNNTTATLYIVSTPIGNLADITFRAVEALQSADLIAAEDTRHSRILLEHFKITTHMTSLHGDNEKAKTTKLLRLLKEGKSIALISDAGTPLISDPGEYLVTQIRQAGFSVTPIPGACALIAALSVSGLSTRRFRFEGFLPHKTKARREIMEASKYDSATLIFYESRHDILDFFKLAISVFGGARQAVMARELTKQFETIHADSLEMIYNWILADKNQQKGEYVILIAGTEEQQDNSGQRILEVLCKHLPTKQAAKLTAEITGGSQRDYYQQALTFKE
jgi:16S rRNA (cytidine1402-2'-O)-methyltransferase